MHKNNSEDQLSERLGMYQNVPEMIFRGFDRLTLPVINRLIRREIISRRLDCEQAHTELPNFEYSIRTLGAIHERAASAVSHLSIMLALCIFLLSNQSEERNPFIYYFTVFDTSIYIILVLLSVRCLKAIGLGRDYVKKEDYEANLRRELVIKYSIMQVVTSFTLVATVLLMIAMIFYAA